MKAHVKTREEKQIEEDRKATNRVFKIALIAISDELGIGAKRLHIPIFHMEAATAVKTSACRRRPTAASWISFPT